MSAKQNNSTRRGEGLCRSGINKLSFEQAIKELTGIVTQVEQGQIPLADSLQQYEKGMALIKHCREILQKAEKRIEKISREEQSEDRKQNKKTGGISQKTDNV